MQIKTERHHLDFMCPVLLKYFPLLRITLYKNVERFNKVSAEYLQTRVIISIIDEVELILRRKDLTESKKINIKLSDAQGIVIYKTILEMPLAVENVYGHMVRLSWLQQLDQQIIYDLNLLEDA